MENSIEENKLLIRPIEREHAFIMVFEQMFRPELTIAEIAQLAEEAEAFGKKKTDSDENAKTGDGDQAESAAADGVSDETSDNTGASDSEPEGPSEEFKAPYVEPLAVSLASIVAEHFNEADSMIIPRLRNWSIDRLPIETLAILRLGVCELFFAGDEITNTPYCINGCVQLAKKYCREKDPKFINGVLGAIVRENDGN